MNSQTLLIATKNAGKLREMREILRDVLETRRIVLRTLEEFPTVSEVEEIGATFVENATLKARSYASQTNLLTLADDSGLEVEALDGAPGVLSARYGGSGLDDAARRALLLEALKGVPTEKRRARFVCVIALFDPQTEKIDAARGECFGHIAEAPRGAHGFGYDPIFIPDGYAHTFGELSVETKKRISHRARAIAAMRDILNMHLKI